ncbi:MAG: glycosyltransferase family 4 protein [Bacteroidetes bacterium]|nr:glycosyltransferase family 4 protein [Bacteroidota bacterium]
MKKRITHLTSAHARYDTRIYFKMCSSLAKNENYRVSLVVADGKGNETKNGVEILDIGTKTSGRIYRMTSAVGKVLKKAQELNSDVYHIHDPELIPIGLKLKKSGKKIVFDSHEDIEKDILSKKWIPFFIRKITSKIYMLYESYAFKKIDYIIAATPYIRDKFLKINKNCIDINNFPIIDELSNLTLWNEKRDEVCYVGGIAQIRGIKEVVNAMGFTKNVRLNLVGIFSEKDVEDEVKTYNGWRNVTELGFLGRSEVAKIMSYSKAGLVTLHPIVTYLDALPVKMYEYMAAGLPVISSDIKLWKEIVEGNNCGICVNPLDPKAIADAIEYILAHPEEAEQMGKNGKDAVENRYNWGVEEKKLMNVYHKLLND